MTRLHETAALHRAPAAQSVAADRAAALQANPRGGGRVEVSPRATLKLRVRSARNPYPVGPGVSENEGRYERGGSDLLPVHRGSGHV